MCIPSVLFSDDQILKHFHLSSSTSPKIFPSQCNSRCCCNETPSTAGRTQEYFYPHFILKLFLKKLCYMIYVLDTKCIPVRTAYACALAINTHLSQSIMPVRNAYIAGRNTTLLVPVYCRLKISRFHPVVDGISFSATSSIQIYNNDRNKFEYFQLAEFMLCGCGLQRYLIFSCSGHF